MDIERLKQTLSDAGCSCDAAKDIVQLCAAGELEGALRRMKKDRSRLLEEFHESGRRVDRLDTLIRSTEKEMTVRQIDG